MGLAGDREPIQRMLGELARDAGMLALVFGMLDALIKTSAGEERRVEWWWYPALIGISIAIMVFGLWLERSRKEER
ncbi:MAG: hypothetical protein ACXWLM_07550 [Myxococcales bacterium]